MTLFSTIFGSKVQNNDSFEILSPSAFKEAISKSKVQLVDVRTPQEYKGGSIKKAINIDIFQSNSFQEKIQKLDKNQPVYIFCRSGSRSKRAAGLMLKLGFTKIFDLQGGYMAWQTTVGN
ncbi:MAG: rhodanese-like domain-containing protein [Flavobacteriaceae bacterium]|nr:rhodanese-like domain-containing protein [Flavobacteriaceae bacterium]